MISQFNLCLDIISSLIIQDDFKEQISGDYFFTDFLADLFDFAILQYTKKTLGIKPNVNLD